MKNINYIMRSAMLFILLLVGWTTGCPLSARIAVGVIPYPSTNLVGGTDDGSDIQPLDSLKAPVFSQSSCDFYLPFELTIIDINEPSVTVKYTLDGSVPDKDNGLTYSSPITIPTGKDITVKAVAISENVTSPVTTAVYHYIPKYLLSVKLPNKNGINYIYYSSDTEYGEWYDEGSTYITEGENVYIGYGVNTGYKCKSVTLNGTPQSISENNLEYKMPASDVEIVIDTEFDPSSPSDPQPGDTTKYYNLSLVSNPIGASSISGAGKYAAGASVYIGSSSNSGYVFTGWTKDGETISTNSGFNYTMPSADVVLTANYVYNPSSPSDPQQPALKHPLTVVASPAGAGTFSTSGSEVTFGEEYYVYAYPKTGYKFKGWIVNGVAVDNSDSQGGSSTTYRGIMTEAGAQVVGLFVFDPSSPSNPGANYYNSTTGQAIIDDFSIGNLYDALSNAVGYDNFSNVSSLIVKGRMSAGDYGCLSYLTNANTIDLSRTGGTTDVPGYAFQSLNASDILLPASVTSIGNYAFRNCSNLVSLTVYAQEPPTCNSRTFYDFTNKDNCTVFVPVSAIELYANAEYWKDFTILPITNDAHVLQVNLPEDASDGRYKYNSLEIVNINSGVRQKYVITDRMLYTFNNLRKDEQYNIYMFSQAGLEIGRIENVVIPDQDIEVTFDNLKSLHTVFAKVLVPDGSDVTSQVAVEWLKPLADGTETYLRKAVSLGEIPDGQPLICRVTLNDKLGVVYANPENVEFAVSADNNTCVVSLVPFRSIELTGAVIDGDGAALSGASVSVNQTLNGKYSKTYTAKTDRKGLWRVSVLDAPETRLTYAATECVNVNDTIGVFEANVNTLDLGKTTLKSIVGARVTYGFTYHAAGSEDIQDYYPDYQNVAVSVFNVTQNRAHNDISLQYPILAVLDEGIHVGDELKLTVTSKTGVFNPIVETVVVDDNQRAEVTFDIVGKGGISASFEMTDNPAVTAMLYGANGEMIKKTTYSEAKVLFTELEDGDYTLITMGQSDLMNSILRLSNFGELGLTEGKDYVKNTVVVESGKLAEVKIPEVPAFDESLFYYTNSSTGFSANKSSITTGNYLTLRSTIDFKGVYKGDINNVALVVDLPEACDFVEQSVIQGPNLLPYTLDNNRLTVQLGNNYQTLTRFCVIPTAGGSFNATASIIFEYNGKTLTQPIGSAISEIKDIEINVPSVIASTSFKVSGITLGNSIISIYEDGVLLGGGKANAAGSWNVECELVNSYNLSKHSIYAEITTPAGNTLISETKGLTYDMNALRVSKVTMYHWNPELNGWKGSMETSVFDFLNPKMSATQWTVYYPKKQFTYTIEFTDNDPERISNVILYVHTADGQFVPVNASFDEKKGMWYAEIDMGTSSDSYYPVNCSVDFEYVPEKIIDNNQLLAEYNSLSTLQEQVISQTTAIDEIYGQIKDELKKDEVDFSTIDSLNSKLEVLLGISQPSTEDADIDENELYNMLETFKQEYGESSIEGLLNAKLTSINYNIPDEFGTGNITVTTCLGYDLTAVEQDSIYEKLKVSGDKQIFAKATDSTYIILDFEEDICYNITFNSESELALFAHSAANDVSQIQKHSKTIGEKINAAINLLNKLLGAIDQVAKHIDGGLKFAKEGYVHSWMKLVELKRLQQAGEQIPGNRIFLLELTCDGWKTEIKTLTGIRSALTNVRVQAIGKLFGACGVISNFVDCKKDLDDFIELYYSVPQPCEKEQERANSIRSSIRNAGVAAGFYYVANISADVCALFGIGPSIVSAPATGGSSLAVALVAIGKIALSYGINALYRNSCDAFINSTRRNILSLQCDERDCGEDGMPPCPPPPGGGGNGSGGNGNGGHGGNGGGGSGSGSPNDNVQIDPSGFVYEAIPGNRVEGVQATIYYKETKEDMYGDPYEEVVLWNAEEYAQKNPLFTDENGMYRWDVPQGLWQVKFEKDGYQTAYSEWLPVPPPQLEVNIGITQNKQPEVAEARAYEEGVEVQFDKFMDLSTLTTANICVTANGEKLNGEIRLIDSALADEYASEDDADAIRYASRVRFVPEEKLSATTGEIRVIVSRNVLSYAGIPMTETYSQVLDVEKEVQTITAEDVKVLYGGEKEVTVHALPYEAAVGRTLHIANSSDLIASIDVTEATLDDEGKAVVKVKGDLPGRAQLTFTIDDVTATGECAVDVVTEIITAEAPKSSRASGTSVYRGTKVELSTESKNATIYFTTDGSCPCDENGTRRKYTVPIVINEDTKILAMTSVGTGDDDVSETVEFNYTLKRSDMDFQMAEGWTWVSHNFESAIAPADLSTDEGVSRILSQTQEVIRDPQLGMVGTLTELKASESYKVETSSATARQRMSNIAWNPATPITLNSGWNWLGYPVGQTMSVDEAFATTAAEALDIVVGQNGFAQFDGEKWVGTLETMSPGMGYMYQSQSGKNVIYNTSIVSTASAKYVPGISSNTPLVLDIHKYGTIMPVIATINNTDGLRLDNEDYQVTAFCGTECRGIGRVVNGLVMMNVYGNINDHITLQVTDVNGEHGFSNNASLNFSETVVGDIFNPYAITIDNSTDIAKVAYNGKIRVTVKDDMLLIKGIDASDINLVEVYDTDGKKLIHRTNVSKSGIRISTLTAGVYVVIVNGKGEYTYHKVAIH